MGEAQGSTGFNDYNVLTNEYTDDDLTEELPNTDIKCIIVTEMTDRVISTISSGACLDGLLTVTESWVAENRDYMKPSGLDELGWDHLENRALDFQNLLRDIEQDRRGLLNIIVDWRLNSSEPASLTCDTTHKKEVFAEEKEVEVEEEEAEGGDGEDEEGEAEGEEVVDEGEREEFDLSAQYISLNGMRVRLLCESENRLKNYMVRRRELFGAYMREMLRVYLAYLSFHYIGDYHHGTLPAMCQSDLTYVKSLGLTI